ncbi:MAG: NifX-associated nitrogen fixation protein [Paenibacillus sp.]|nr:NifX-associated nitrogen fixation protein [Paenibacillus sp.]
MEPMAEGELTSTLAEKGMVDAFTRRLCQLLDTEDFFGRHASLSEHEKIERLFLASSEDKTQSDFNCAVSPKVRLQVPMLFQAVAGVMEERSGAIIQSAAEMNGEGFGRALLYSGRIILVLKSLRAGFPFPFTSQDKAVRYGIACVEEGLAFLEKYNKMTALHGSFSLEG